MKDVIGDMVSRAVEAPVHPDQKDIEAKLLATLAAVINDRQDVQLTLCILSMDEEAFHFRDHREVFAAMKALAEAGDHVDQATVRAKILDKWPDTLATVFDKTKADVAAAKTYMGRVIYWADVEEVRDILNGCLAGLEKPEADLLALSGGLHKAAFDIEERDRIAPAIRSQADLSSDFMNDLENPKPVLKTGFDMLDGIIRGLTPGLFVIAAPPSAGKTTFVNQLADQVAELNAVPVLFFSYEQSAFDLWVKSMARLAKVANESIRGILSLNVKERAAVARKIAEVHSQYRYFAKRIKVIESDRRQTAERIRLEAQREKAKTGKPPVLIIDYLQIVPAVDSLNDKRAEVDALVSDLRRIARDIGSPVIAVSSMSRAQYDRVRMDAFKESGGIEYGTDIAAVLTVEDEEEGTRRTVKLNILKNRNGRRGYVGMKYDMTRDTFEETDQGFQNYLDALGKDRGEDQ